MSSVSRRMARPPAEIADPLSTLYLAIGFVPSAGEPLPDGPISELRSDLQDISDALARMSVRESGQEIDEKVQMLAEADAGLQRIAASLEEENIETAVFRKTFERRSREIDEIQARTDAMLLQLVGSGA